MTVSARILMLPLMSDVGVSLILLLVLLMLGAALGIGLVDLLARLRGRGTEGQSAELEPENGAERPEASSGVEGKAAGEGAWAARWVSCLGSDLSPAARTHGAGMGASRLRPGQVHPLARWLITGVVAATVGAAGFLAFGPRVVSSPEKQAKDAIVLTSIDKWADSINMFEDKLRIRFRYRNTTKREVDAFNVYFLLRSTEGDTLIMDQISIPNRVRPHQTSSWTEEYWATCPQGFTAEDWDALTHKDITDFEVEWIPVGLVFSNGEAIR